MSEIVWNAQVLDPYIRPQVPPHLANDPGKRAAFAASEIRMYEDRNLTLQAQISFFRRVFWFGVVVLAGLLVFQNGTVLWMQGWRGWLIWGLLFTTAVMAHWWWWWLLSGLIILSVVAFETVQRWVFPNWLR